MVSESDVNRDESWMARAIDEARRAEGDTSPNPLVGCVITRGGELEATGYHRRPGDDHAEIDALDNLEGSPGGCELYVNLEPCSHYGRTPPCVEALIEAGVERVVVGCIAPHPRVDGDGVAALREAGIQVDVGVLEDEARRLNRPYIKYITRDVPWVSVKYAMSLDGNIATRTGDSAWISNEASRQRVHEMRDRCDAILVGTGTVRSDDPRLTARIEGGDDPLRVILDARLEGSLDETVYRPDGQGADTLVVTSEDAPSEARATLHDRGVETIDVPTDSRGFLAWQPLLEALADREIVRLFVEGGGTVVGTLLDDEHIDCVHAFVAPKLIGGEDAPGPVRGLGAETMDEAVEAQNVELESIEGDVLVTATFDHRSESSD